MTEAAAGKLVAGIALVFVAVITSLAWGTTGVVWLLVAAQVWVLLTRATHAELTVLRRRTMHALATLRRRHDSELMEVWCAAKGKPAAEYVAQGWDAPREIAEPEVFEPDPEPATAPIEIAPETVPDGMPLAVQSALIAEDAALSDEEWQARQDAEYEAAMAKIRGM